MEILDPSEALPLRGRGAPSKYPWDSWFRNGQTVRIFKGEDFEVDIVTMRQMIYQKAKSFGGRVSTALGKDARGRQCLDVTYYMQKELDLEIEV